MSKSNLIAIATWVCFFGCVSDAVATNRYAVIVGANKGDPTEAELSFAERDAKRVSEVLEQLGNFDAENMVTLLGTDAETVLRVMTKLNKRIEQEGSEDSMLFVYFSGHADTTSLHLDGTSLPFKDVRSVLNESKAAFKVLVIDACKSGEFTRVKGAEPAEAFDIEASRWKTGHGMAVITSSAAGEDAQESDRLRSGFFTHYLVAGLRGAADKSNDKEVTLSEVYDYVYDETLRATSAARFIQHPTYAYDIRGKSDVTLTRMESRRSGGTLRMTDPGKYLLFEGNEKGELVAEIQVDDDIEMALSTGTYFVRRRVDYKLYEAQIKVEKGAKTVLFGSGMDEVPQGEVARKGIGVRKTEWAVMAAGGYGQHAIKEIGFTPFVAGGVHVDARRLSAELRLRFWMNSTATETVETTHQQLALDLAGFYVWNFRPLSFGVGVKTSGGVIRQTFDGFMPESPRLGFIGSVGPLLNINVDLFRALTLGLRAGGDAIIVPRSENPDLGVVFSPYGEFSVRAYF